MLPLARVLGEQLQALDKARAAGLHRQLQRLGVGHQRVGRAERVHHLAQREPPLGLAALVERRGVERLLHQLGLGQIGPRDGLEARVLGPRLAGEAAVLDRLRARRGGAGIAASHGAAICCRMSICIAVTSATAFVHGAVAAARALDVSATSRLGHITALGGHQVGEPAGRVGRRAGDIRSLHGSRVNDDPAPPRGSGHSGRAGVPAQRTPALAAGLQPLGLRAQVAAGDPVEQRSDESRRGTVVGQPERGRASARDPRGQDVLADPAGDRRSPPPR